MIADERITPAQQEVLVVEDTQASLRLLADILTKQGQVATPFANRTNVFRTFETSTLAAEAASTR